MNLKLTKNWKAFQPGSIVDVDEETAKALQAAEVGVPWTQADTMRIEEQAAVVKSAVAEAFKGFKPQSVTNEQPRDTDYKDLGEFLGAVKSKRVTYKVCNGSGNEEQTDDEGGYLVDQQFSRKLITRMMNSGTLAKGVDRIPIGAGHNGIKFNGRSDYDRRDGQHAVNVYRIGEACEKTKSTPKFERLSCDLEKLCGLYYATDELLQDTPALAGMVESWFGAEFAYQLDHELLHGTGGAECLGVLNSAALVTITRNAADAVDANDIARMYSRMYPASIGRAEWFVSSSVLPQLIGMTIGNTPVWLPPTGLAATPYGSLFGRPINVSEVCPALGEVGDIGFFDMSEYLLIEKGGVDTQSSIHVRFVYDETAYRFVLRNNGLPKWSRTLYPSQGTDVVSPWVVLEGQGGTPTPTI